MERFTADLAEQHLMSAFTGTEKANGLRCCGDRREHTEATHEPHILNSTVLLEVNTNLVLALQHALLRKSVS